jgi:K+-transporting ATPase KdpF subunit
MRHTILLITQDFGTTTGYVAGALISLFLLGYLLYSLIKPEKF